MRTLVFFLEEPSAREMLHGILPHILPAGTDYRCIVFQGKQDLAKNLKRKLMGWKLPNSVFIVLQDQDSGDCKCIKKRLNEICRQSGKAEVLVRVACRELESFYLGDLQAVEKGLKLDGLSLNQNKKKFRAPDTLGNPSEELLKLTGYKYQKISGSRAISPHLRLDGNNKSRSFQVLIDGIKKILLS